jgi:hypothetical protein
MNDVLKERWCNMGLLVLVLALILAVALVLITKEGPLVQGGAGLVGLILIGVCLIALLLVLAGLWPGFTGRAQDHLVDSTVKAFLVGLVNYAFLGAIALVLLNSGPIAFTGLVLGGILLLGTFLGLPAVAALVGERLHALRETEATPWSDVVTGGAALYLAAFVPVVGWFLLLPALCLWSFGAAALALVNRQRPAVEDVA